MAVAFCLLATAVLIEDGLFGGLSSSASEPSSVVSGIMATRFRPASRTGATGPSHSGSDSAADGAGGIDGCPWSAGGRDGGPWLAGGGGDCGPWSADGVGEGGALMAGT